MARPWKPPRPTEAQVLRQVKAYLDATRLPYFRMNTGAVANAGRWIRFGSRGMSDLLILLPGGRALWCEVKRPGGKPTPAQQAFLGMVRARGCAGAVVTSVEELREVLQREGVEAP